MTLFTFAQWLSQVFNSIPLDDSSLSVLAMLAGIIGGWTLTSLHQQTKAKKVKLPRKPPANPRKPQ